MSKQTAVEWLVDEFKALGIYSSTLKEKCEQAKAMEKQQIINARNNGFEISGEGWNGEYGIKDFNKLTEEIKSEQYYNETFKD
jgi:hypothetical protein